MLLSGRLTLALATGLHSTSSSMSQPHPNPHLSLRRTELPVGLFPNGAEYTFSTHPFHAGKSGQSNPPYLYTRIFAPSIHDILPSTPDSPWHPHHSCIPTTASSNTHPHPRSYPPSLRFIHHGSLARLTESLPSIPIPATVASSCQLPLSHHLMLLVLILREDASLLPLPVPGWPRQKQSGASSRRVWLARSISQMSIRLPFICLFWVQLVCPLLLACSRSSRGLQLDAKRGERRPRRSFHYSFFLCILRVAIYTH